MFGNLLALAHHGNTIRAGDLECSTGTRSAETTYRLNRAAEKILLGEYDLALAEFDRVKHDSCSNQELRLVYGRYMDAITRLTAFLGKGAIPTEVRAPIESL
jgi:hypothetical protein